MVEITRKIAREKYCVLTNQRPVLDLVLFQTITSFQRSVPQSALLISFELLVRA